MFEIVYTVMRMWLPVRDIYIVTMYVIFSLNLKRIQ